MVEKFQLKDGRELIIRPIQISDYEANQEYVEQVATETQFTRQYVGKPRQSLEDFAQMITENWILLALDGDKIVGSVLAHPNKHPWQLHVCSYGIYMLDAYQHNGLGHYFMKRLEKWAQENKIHRIEGEVRAINMSAIALYLKHGFIIEGYKRDCVCIDGVWYSNYVIGKIFDE